MGALRQHIAAPFIGAVHDRGVTSSRRWKTSQVLGTHEIQARRGRAIGHPLQRRLLRWFYQSVEDAFTDAGMVSKSASTAARVTLSTREGDLIHGAVRRRWREPVHQHIAGHVERHLGRKTIEYLVYLRRQRKSSIFNHGVRSSERGPARAMGCLGSERFRGTLKALKAKMLH